MSIDDSLVAELANKFLAAEEQRAPIEPITSLYPALTADDAYRVQFALAAAKIKRGEKLIGKKVGATNERVQKTFGLDGPVFAHLFASSQVANGGTIAFSK